MLLHLLIGNAFPSECFFAEVQINNKWGITDKSNLVVLCIHNILYSEEEKQSIKTKNNDYTNSLKRDLGREPTFQEFVKDLINHTSKDQAEKNFYLLKLGWELNGKTANFGQVYGNIFSFRKAISHTFLDYGADMRSPDKWFKK